MKDLQQKTIGSMSVLAFSATKPMLKKIGGTGLSGKQHTCIRSSAKSMFLRIRGYRLFRATEYKASVVGLWILDS